QSSTVTACAVCIDATTVRQTLQGLQRIGQDFVRWRAAQLGDEASAASIVVWVSPVRMRHRRTPVGTSTHSSVIVSKPPNVQCRIFLACIGFLGARNRLTTLKLRDFTEVKIADFHWGNDHFEGFFAGSAACWAQGFNVP